MKSTNSTENKRSRTNRDSFEWVCDAPAMVILAPYQHKVGEEEVVIQAEEDALDLEKGGLIFGGKEYRLSGGVVLTHGSYRKGPKSTW